MEEDDGASNKMNGNVCVKIRKRQFSFQVCKMIKYFNYCQTQCHKKVAVNGSRDGNF